MDVKLVKIDDIGLSVRASNALHRAGVETVGDLFGYTEDMLYDIRNMGKKSVDEILLKIDEYKRYDSEGGLPDPEPEKEDDGPIRIDSIGLSVRSLNALHSVGVQTVGDMLGYTEDMLYSIRSIGQKSVDEILLKIEEYRDYDTGKELPGHDTVTAPELPEFPEDFHAFINTDEGKEFICSWIRETGTKVSDLELLSARAYNFLLLNGYSGLEQVIFMTSEDLLQIPRMDVTSAEEIEKRCSQYLEDHRADILASLENKHSDAERNRERLLREMLHDRKNHDSILKFVKDNDRELESLPLSNRAKNSLRRSGKLKISDFIFMSARELLDLQNMGTKSVDEILSLIDDYLNQNETRIRALLSGDINAAWDDNDISNMILGVYNEIGFEGLSMQEMRDKSIIPDQVTDERLKSILGKLIAESKLEYVDFRCYRVYPRFVDYLAECTAIRDRNKEIIIRRLNGETLEGIAASYGMTRERVRQIVNQGIKKARANYTADTNMKWVDEDYYRYFFETYEFDKKDAGKWLGIEDTVFNYLELTDSKQGTRDLEEAVDDYHNLDFGFRLKVKNYLNRNKLYLDGRWIEKNRAELEEYVIKKYCRDSVSFEEFSRIYNDFLRGEDVDYDEKIYYTDAVIRTRKNHLAESRYLLWKQNEQIRYYDIDGQDFTELLDTLNLEAYENIEYSTTKFMRDYPEIMVKYDIRDQYELHNLLRKIVKDGDYHDFHCDRMPVIRFGSFDRDGAIFDILIDHAPITQAELADLVSQEYGYDPLTVIANYLQPFSAYYHRGGYTIDQKTMADSNRKALLSVLTDDFYYIDEIRKTYASIVPGADLEEINPYNLKIMGFSVLSRYVYRNHSTLDAYFRDLLTKEDITDITPIRRRFAYVVAFSGTFNNMKNNLEIFEFEPNQIITFDKLAAAGITKEDIHAFCDDVADYVEDGSYFSIQSIKKNGFESELFDLGFSDWFYANLLTADTRFSYTKAFGNIILYKGNERITIQSFEEELIKEQGSIDVYDLMTEMEEVYGCKIPERLDLIYKVGETDVYYDKYLDRLYANSDIFNRELDAVGEMV